MYTPKRLKTGKPSSPYPASPFNLTKELHRDTPNKGAYTPSKVKVLEQDDSYQLLSYGDNLPVKIAEVLAASDNAAMSAKISNSGWACIIDNRKLYAWKTSSGSKKSVNTFEFQLASTVINHKSALTCVFESSSSDSVYTNTTKTSLISVSPEGTARYWQNITQPALMVEVNLSIGDKQCSSIQSIMPYGCVLVTTTNELYHIMPSNSGMNYHQVSLTSGMLSNISRRMSSFWSQPAVVQSKHTPILCNGTLDFDALERHIFVSLDKKLQKWEISGTLFSSSKMLFDVDLGACFDNYAGKTEFTPDGIVDDVQVVDMKNTGSGVVLLLALWKGNDYKVVLGTLKTNVDGNSSNFERITAVDYHENELSKSLQLNIPFPGYQAFISTSNMIISLPATKSTRNHIKVTFDKSPIIGTGCCGTDSIYLTRKDGLVNLKISYVVEPALIEKSQIKMFNEEPGDEASTPTDLYSTVQSLFISHTQGKVQNILNLLSSLECTGIEFGAVIMKIASELLDSYPPSDPRWLAGNAAFPPSSVLLLNQIRDKEKIFDEYLNFISVYDLLNKCGEPNDAVKIFLHEGAEKIRCASALLDVPSDLTSIIDDVINSAELEVDEGENVNRKDSFFAKITNIDKFFSVLLKVEDSKLANMLAINDQVGLILVVSQIITSCFQTAWQYRCNAGDFLPSRHVPWTGSSTGQHNRSLLKHQLDVIVNQGLCNVDSTKVGSVLTQQVVLLSDLLFDGYLKELSIMKHASTSKDIDILETEYNEERNKIIMALVNLGYFEESATLAEHYKDFHMLIFLCNRTNDTEKLEHYKNEFKDEGFDNILYKWYMDKGAWSQLMTNKDNSNDFDSMLSSHDQLSWIHFIGTEQYGKASEVLSNLANDEKEFCSRKKSMLVLSNLAMLAADKSAEVIEAKISDIDKQLELLTYQDLIMKDIIKDTSEESAPLSAEELIKLCLDENIPTLTENQYISLIEMIQFLSTNQQQYLLDIWSKCLLQDNWDEGIHLDATATMSQKVFYKCLKYWKEKDRAGIPPLKDLAPSISTTTDSMLHQLKVCYELLSLQELTAGV